MNTNDEKFTIDETRFLFNVGRENEERNYLNRSNAMMHVQKTENRAGFTIFYSKNFSIMFFTSCGIFKRKDFKILMVLPLISLIEGNPDSI